VYPLFEKYLGDQGKNMADEDRAEHLVSIKLCGPLLLYSELLSGYVLIRLLSLTLYRYRVSRSSCIIRNR
jgi:hypothetical protein